MTYSIPCYFGMHRVCDGITAFTDYDGKSRIRCGCECHDGGGVS